MLTRVHINHKYMIKNFQSVEEINYKELSISLFMILSSLRVLTF